MASTPMVATAALRAETRPVAEPAAERDDAGTVSGEPVEVDESVGSGSMAAGEEVEGAAGTSLVTSAPATATPTAPAPKLRGKPATAAWR